MKVRPTHALVAGLMVSVSLSVLAWAAGNEPPGRASGESPLTEPGFKPGDIVAVAPERANLMRGAEVVAVVPGGQRIVVVEVRDQWVGAYVLISGEKKAGWLRTTDFIPVNDSAKPPEGQVCPCAKQATSA
jgi:hypothetical protein